MLKMAVYSEANAILGSSLSPSNYCICKATAIANGANASKIELIVANAASNRLIPVSALLTSVVTYTIRFLDWDGTVLKTEYVVAGSNPTPPTNPTRSGYTFTGWSPSIGVANLNQDYTATYSLDTQYSIIFAERKVYAYGIYFIMNDDSVVPVSNLNQISSSDVKAVAYLDSTASSSYIIDTVEATNIQFGYPDTHSNAEIEHIYDTSRTFHGDGTTQALKDKQSSSSPMPSITYCNSRGNDWYIPSEGEIDVIVRYLGDLNTALNFIGGTPIPYNNNNQFSQDNYYWSCTYENGSLSQVRAICAYQTTQYGNVEYSTDGYLKNCDETARLRLIKCANIQCPEVPVDIYETKLVNAGVTPQPTTNPTRTGYELYGWNPVPYPADKDETYIAIWYALPEPVDQDVSMISGITTGWREKANYTTYDTNEWLLSGRVPINVSCLVCFFNNGTEITNDSTVIATYLGNTNITISDLTWTVQPNEQLHNNLHYEMSGKRFQSWATGNCTWNSTDSFVCSGKWNGKVVCKINITVKCYKSSIAAGKQDGDIVPASEWN